MQQIGFRESVRSVRMIDACRFENLVQGDQGEYIGVARISCLRAGAAKRQQPGEVGSIRQA